MLHPCSCQIYLTLFTFLYSLFHLLMEHWFVLYLCYQSSSGGPQATSDAQQKVEATAENSATSNHSSGYEACIQRNRECIEKGSDAQVVFLSHQDIRFEMVNALLMMELVSFYEKLCHISYLYQLSPLVGKRNFLCHDFFVHDVLHQD